MIFALILAALAMLLGIGFFNLHAFLAITRRIPAKALVVEGWLFDYMLKEALAEFKSGGYERLIVTGISKPSVPVPDPVQTQGKEATGNPERTAGLLQAWGVAPEAIAVVTWQGATKHKTFHSALALKQWLGDKADIPACNIFTAGPHGRKTLTIFRRVIGKAAKLGIISCRVTRYNDKQWWNTPYGFYLTARNFAGYLYGLFWPFNGSLE